ncbi:MAG: DMT family transporter [Wenzhouxiangellaceae bacterium]|nr:DMT family transporter [Wenzhouxiangellaceae bacterium]
MQTGPGPRAIGLVTFGAVAISFAAVFVRLADVPATTSAFYRMVFGGAALLALLAAFPRMRAGFGRGWLGSALIAAFFTADMWLWHRSILIIGPGLATLLANFQVFVLTAIGVVWFREHIGPRSAGAVVLAVAGLWLLFGRDWVGLAPEFRLGIVLGLLTALAYSAYILSLRGARLRRPEVCVEARLAQVTLLCGAMLGVVGLFEGHAFAIPDGRSLAALVALGVVCQVAGWLAITRGMPGLPASLVGLLLLLQPTLSIFWDLAWFGLRLDVLQALGAALALAGIYLGMRAGAARRRSDGQEPT